MKIMTKKKKTKKKTKFMEDVKDKLNKRKDAVDQVILLMVFVININND